jgi:hypothetical protein
MTVLMKFPDFARQRGYCPCGLEIISIRNATTLRRFPLFQNGVYPL